MKFNTRHSAGAVLPLTILLLLTLLTLWLNRTVELSAPQEPGPPKHEPDYIVERFNIKRLSDAGEPRYVLSASRMTHYPDDDSSHLDLPRLVQAQPGKPDTRVSAMRGVVSSNGEEVKLYSSVELFKAGDSAPGKKEDDMRVRSEYLRVLPDSDRADTHTRVVIEQGKAVLIGTGMKFNNRYRQIELQSAVTGIFERKK